MYLPIANQEHNLIDRYGTVKSFFFLNRNAAIIIIKSQVCLWASQFHVFQCLYSCIITENPVHFG